MLAQTGRGVQREYTWQQRQDDRAENGIHFLLNCEWDIRGQELGVDGILLEMLIVFVRTVPIHSWSALECDSRHSMNRFARIIEGIGSTETMYFLNGIDFYLLGVDGRTGVLTDICLSRRWRSQESRTRSGSAAD